MHELMTVSDLIFSKAGGLTVSECMAKGLPMVINKVIPGQEEDNVNYLILKGAAIKENDFVGIVKALNGLLADFKKIENMKKAALKIGHPNSATALADFAMDKINESR
jgi:processive 1,2-diacylglycerol beta-glucosyltransferase